MRLAALAAIACTTACGAGPTPSRGPTTTDSTTAAVAHEKPSAGDAARVICEAACRRKDRCGKGEAECTSRCGALPIREPPVWHTDWARQVGTCIETAECAHDADEKCTSATDRRTQSYATCAESATSEKSMRFCEILNGLTEKADREMDACMRGGTPFKKCAPPFDWK